MRTVPLAILIAGLGFSGPSTPPSQPEATGQESIDRAFAHALGRARSMAGKLDLSTEHSSWEDPWVIQSKNYELRTTASRAYGVRMINALEGMLPIYRQLLDTDYVPRTPVPVLIHPTQEAYGQYGDDHSDERSSVWGGFFDPNNPGGAIAAVYDPNENLERMYLVYASCQQFVHQAFGDERIPTALTQGLGAYAQTFWQWDFLLTRFEAMRDAGTLPSLNRLLSASSAEFAERGDEFLVPLAVTFAYLRNYREDTASRRNEAGPFDRYVRKVVRGESVDEEPVHQLLSVGLADLDAEIRAFRGWRRE